MYETNFRLRDLTVELGHISSTVDSKDVSIEKAIKIINDFGS